MDDELIITRGQAVVREMNDPAVRAKLEVDRVENGSGRPDEVEVTSQGGCWGERLRESDIDGPSAVTDLCTRGGGDVEDRRADRVTNEVEGQEIRQGNVSAGIRRSDLDGRRGA